LARRKFLDVYQSKITTDLTATATSLVLASVTGLAAQDVLIIEEGRATAEVVFVTAVNTVTLTATIVRAMGGTTAVAHEAGSTVCKVGAEDTIMVRITDLGTAATQITAMPKCILVRVWGVLPGAITTADEVITLLKNAQAITGGTITIANSGSALGDVDECLPTLYNEFNGTTDYLSVANSGASTAAYAYYVNCKIIRL
jgi:hypothetical protein